MLVCLLLSGLMRCFENHSRVLESHVDDYFIFEQPVINYITFESIIKKANFAYVLRLRRTSNRTKLEVTCLLCFLLYYDITIKATHSKATHSEATHFEAAHSYKPV